MNYYQTTTLAPTCKPACVPKHNGGPLLNGDLGDLIEMDNSESTTGTDKHCRLLNQCQIDEQHTQHLTEKKNTQKKTQKTEPAMSDIKLTSKTVSDSLLPA